MKTKTCHILDLGSRGGPNFPFILFNTFHQGVPHWRVKPSGVRQSKIYKCHLTLIGAKGLRSKKKSQGGFCFQSSSSIQDDKSTWQLLNNLSNLSHDVSGIFNVKEIKCVLVKCYREITSQANLLAQILVQGWLQSKGYDVSWNNYCLSVSYLFHSQDGTYSWLASVL